MYVQVVTFGLNGIDESQYLDAANDVAPRFAGRPGLLAKIWLEDPEQGRYGAIYFWEDRESMERLVHSDLFEGANPEFSDVASEGFAILENLTAQTQPVIELVENRRRAVGKQAPKAVAAAKASPPAKKAPAAAKKSPVKKAPAAAKKAPAKKAAARGDGDGESKAPAKRAAAAKKAPAKKAAEKATASKSDDAKPAKRTRRSA